MVMMMAGDRSTILLSIAVHFFLFIFDFCDFCNYVRARLATTAAVFSRIITPEGDA
jgi:hypothetical protein